MVQYSSFSAAFRLHLYENLSHLTNIIEPPCNGTQKSLLYWVGETIKIPSTTTQLSRKKRFWVMCLKVS